MIRAEVDTQISGKPSGCVSAGHSDRRRGCHRDGNAPRTVQYVDLVNRHRAIVARKTELGTAAGRCCQLGGNRLQRIGRIRRVSEGGRQFPVPQWRDNAGGRHVRCMAKHADLRFAGRLDGTHWHRAAGRGRRSIGGRRQIMFGAAHIGNLVGRCNLRLRLRTDQH